MRIHKFFLCMIVAFMLIGNLSGTSSISAQEFDYRGPVALRFFCGHCTIQTTDSQNICINLEGKNPHWASYLHIQSEPFICTLAAPEGESSDAVDDSLKLTILMPHNADIQLNLSENAGAWLFGQYNALDIRNLQQGRLDLRGSVKQLAVEVHDNSYTYIAKVLGSVRIDSYGKSEILIAENAPNIKIALSYEGGRCLTTQNQHTKGAHFRVRMRIPLLFATFFWAQLSVNPDK